MSNYRGFTPSHRFSTRCGRLPRRWRQLGRLPWDRILVLLSCLILVLRLTGNFPTWDTIVPTAIVRPPGAPTAGEFRRSPVGQIAPNPVNNAQSMIQPPLSTRGAAIVDTQGQVVTLRGVNWFGIETENHAPHGLWARDYKEMLAQIKGLGYNLIRLPYSVQALQDQTVTGIDYRIGSNRELEGKGPIAVMDAIVQEAGRQGILILLDSHRLNNRRIPALWYGDGFTERDWIRAWAMLAERYKNQPNVIGADLKNEPHGIASWGTGDRRTDWRLAAERAGNAILKINPNWLIVVEGVEWNVPGQKLAKHWMGGNLEGVRQFPVRLNQPHKVVYSPHEYGPGVFKQKWFQPPDFAQTLRDRWDQGFFYIAREGIAPVLIGEFGGKKVDRDSKEGQWQNLLVDFIQQNQLSYSYWTWNPNSRDTGGILQDDWKTVQAAKQTMLDRTLPVMAMAPNPGEINLAPTYRLDRAPEASPRSSPQPSPTPSPEPAQTGQLDQLQLKTAMQSEWPTGFCTTIAVTNTGRLPVSQWQIRFDMPNATVDQSWNAQYRKQDGQYYATPAEWGRSVQPKQVINLGFCAKKEGSDALPKNFQIMARNG
jgi:endoglucanase